MDPIAIEDLNRTEIFVVKEEGLLKKLLDIIINPLRPIKNYLVFKHVKKYGPNYNLKLP